MTHPVAALFRWVGSLPSAELWPGHEFGGARPVKVGSGRARKGRAVKTRVASRQGTNGGRSGADTDPLGSDSPAHADKGSVTDPLETTRETA
jgi:hypothetical protein